MRRGSPRTAVMDVCFRSISARTSEGIGTFNCWCCWRIGLCFDVEKRWGSGEDTTHATPASSGRPRRRIDTASRVSKSTPCVRCVQPWARRRVSPCARRRLPIFTDGAVALDAGKLIAQELLLGGCPPSSLVIARRRRGCPNRCRRSGLSRAPSCARRSCTCGGCPRVLPGRGQRRCRRSPDATRARIGTPPREPVRRRGAPRGPVAVVGP